MLNDEPVSISQIIASIPGSAPHATPALPAAVPSHRTTTRRKRDPSKPRDPRGLKKGQFSGNQRCSVTDDPLNLKSYIQAAAREVIGEPVRAVAMEQGLAREQGTRVGMICGITVDEFREQVRQKAQQIIGLLQDRIPTIVDSLKPMETFVAYGITMDKYRDLTGGSAPTVVHQTNIQVNGSDRRAAMDALIGSGVVRRASNADVPMETVFHSADPKSNPPEIAIS